jgi:pimeloyl-ACP methyl ester carboxylesterase
MALPLHCETFGAGPPVVCLHGFGASSYTWREIRDSLAASRTVYTLDLKGFGDSPKPRDGRYTVHDQAALVIECIDHLQLTGLTLVGHSFGGGVALVTALELLRSRPGALASLVLLDAASYRQPIPAFIRVLQVPVIGPLLQHLAPARMQVRTVLRLAYFHDELIPDASVEAYAAPLRAQGGPEALRETARQIIPADIDAICARYPTIGVPTLIIWGAHDEIVPLEFGERLRRAIPHSKLVVVENAGHMPHEETPEPVRRAIEEFLTAR